MYTEYANEINEDLVYDETFQWPTDIQLPRTLNILLLVIGAAICLAGFAIIFFAKNILLRIAVIGVPTFFGMVIKPTFALYIMMLVLPTGSGLGRVCF